MARNTEIKPGIHLLKPSAYNGRVQINAPREVAVAAGIDGSMFVGAMVVGKCLIVAQVNHVGPEEMPQELAKIFEKAIEQWEKKKP